MKTLKKQERAVRKRCAQRPRTTYTDHYDCWQENYPQRYGYVQRLQRRARDLKRKYAHKQQDPPQLR